MVDKKLLLNIKKMADSPDWKIRERAASKIKEINDNHFLEYLPVWKKWIKDKNPNIRRAVEIGLLRINKKFVPQSLDLIEPLIYDDNPYVRKNCGAFALSHIGYKNPDLTFRKLNEWAKIDNKNVKWNIAKCLGAWFGKTYTEKSLKLLKILAKDKNKFVQRAAISSIKKLENKS